MLELPASAGFFVGDEATAFFMPTVPSFNFPEQ
jgi:hypothetical protein